MDLKEWCEYIRDIRDFFHIPNAYIAEKADVSIKTIERIIAIDTKQDIMRSTARRIELAVIGPVGEFACFVDHSIGDAELINQLRAANEHLKNENARYAKIIDKYLDL